MGEVSHHINAQAGHNRKLFNPSFENGALSFYTELHKVSLYRAFVPQVLERHFLDIQVWTYINLVSRLYICYVGMEKQLDLHSSRMCCIPMKNL